MVGVPGKSKGCSTCRKRKKGCDLARPACGQCVRSGNTCGGYQRDLTFIHHKVPGKDRPPSLPPDPSPEQNGFHLDESSILTAHSDGRSSLSSSAYECSPAASAEWDWRDSSALVQRTCEAIPSLQVLSPTLTLTALTALHTSLFNSAYLPCNSFAIQEPLGSSGHPANWMQLIPPLVNNDRSLQLAYLALSSCRLGHEDLNDDLLASGKTFYGKALRELQRAISDPKRRHTEETLLACSTLGLYDIFDAQTPASAQLNSSLNGWLSHSAGVARLLEARGPESCTTDKGHQVFLHARISLTIHASTARKGCFLSEPRWLTVPWQNHPKNMQHQLVDVMVFLPVILEAYDNLEKSTNLESKQRRRERQSLLAKCAILSEQLKRWYTLLCSHADGQTLWDVALSDDPTYPFPYLFSFNDHLLAYTIMLYWTCSLVTHGTMRRVEHLLNEEAADMHDVEALPQNINPCLYAFNIAQALPYFLHPDMRALGPNRALFPIGMAFAFFATATRSNFAADWDAIKSIRSMVDDMMEGKGPNVNRSFTDIVLWFRKVFIDLNSRRMPGGVFLSGLLEALGTQQ